MNAIQDFMLGTAIKIISRINVPTATSAKITIDDPSSTEKVTSASMTKDADGIYSYIYQSIDTDEEGDYIATIKINYGAYTSVVQKTFTLIDQE
jgi:hypothetical protein